MLGLALSLEVPLPLDGAAMEVSRKIFSLRRAPRAPRTQNMLVYVHCCLLCVSCSLSFPTGFLLLRTGFFFGFDKVFHIVGIHSNIQRHLLSGKKTKRTYAFEHCLNTCYLLKNLFLDVFWF